MVRAKVMIVEDDLITAMELCNELQNLGYSICSFATSGDKAINIAEQDQPDVVLMGIKLCGEIDGFEAAREIRSRFGISIMYMTGYPEKMVINEGGIRKAYEYIAKPVQIDALQSAIDSVLQKNKEDLGEKR